MQRRQFLTATTSGVLLAGCAPRATTPVVKDNPDEVTPVEDLMREHGVLRRVMYVYDAAIARLERIRVAGADPTNPLGVRPCPPVPRGGIDPPPPRVPLDALVGCAGIVRRVIEDYHEKLEEDFLFPRYEKAGKLADLTAILRKQHQVGRVLTDRIVALAKGSDMPALEIALRSFNHMYTPHAAREDTVLFPVLRSLMTKHEYEELGEQFEDKETQMLGDHGFEHAVDEIARYEQAFGLDDLAKL